MQVHSPTLVELDITITLFVFINGMACVTQLCHSLVIERSIYSCAGRKLCKLLWTRSQGLGVRLWFA